MIIYGIIFFLLIIACFLCLYRIGVGPTAPDRSVAMDILGIVIVCFCAIFGLYTGKEFFFRPRHCMGTFKLYRQYCIS